MFLFFVDVTLIKKLEYYSLFLYFYFSVITLFIIQNYLYPEENENIGYPGTLEKE
ncbi:hypothetical protein SUSAZ_07085 [Sulfolobus acidocaldarius SUSAZ]|nr:hypothetical protein SUSAZ_07085 [Sulfolobus acidocaldarius SUSAZ]